ncbi:hypothetical protein C0J52_22740 [Blattella germanica]|nr:hypothetical protein C0J52_22740 [Blattella germanica]
MCHVDLPLPAAVRISAVSVVVCRWCGKCFCFADVVCPCIEYALMTLDTVPFGTPTTFATVAAEAPTRRAPTNMPSWDSVSSHILLHHLHTTTLTVTAAGRERST